jgi:DNA (cytosine-5)-methyltransferase 1
MSLTFTDLFCGAGGSSTGLVAAGLELKLAANHSRVAVETHAANHPRAEHLCVDINNYDMRRLPAGCDVLWASPICTEISPAGGRKRTKGQLALDLHEHGPIESGAWERTRATAYDVIRAAEIHRYAAVLCENVVEFATDWELFDWWRTGMHHLGYTSQVVSVSSAHIGGEDNPHAPQWRDRLYLVFTRNGIPAPDLTPRPAAWCPECGQQVQAVQSWRNGRRIGKYKQQYDYRCPNASCRHTVVEPHVRPAADAIDWTDLGTRIGDRTRPLAAATMDRIRAGLTAHPTDLAATPFVVEYRNHSTAEPVTRPLATVTAQGNHHALVIPYRAGNLPTTTDRPLHTLSTRDSAALVGRAPAVEDCWFRMLQPREQLTAQRFPADYIVRGTKGEQTMQAGNAVSVNVAQWIGTRVSEALNRTAAHAA